jgi:hypothetical protein
LQALTVLELRAKLAAAEVLAAAATTGSNGSSNVSAPAPDVLTAFVEAHNLGLQTLAECLTKQLHSTAAAWGYSPSEYSSSNVSVWEQMGGVLEGAAGLRLPPPAPLQDFLQQQHGGVGAAALAQLTSYLEALSRSSSSDSWGGAPACVGSVASAVHAVLTAKLLQQKQLLLGGSSNGSSSRVSGRQLQLVRSHCELLLDRLQQQSLLQEVMLVDRADLQLIAAANEAQQQPGWRQQLQEQLLPQGLLQGAEQQQQHPIEKWGVFDLDQAQPWDSPTEVVSVGLQGDAGGDDGEQQSLEQVLLDAKQQAAEAAVMLALFGLGEKPRRLH